jgi:hypothetical protein
MVTRTTQTAAKYVNVLRNQNAILLSAKFIVNMVIKRMVKDVRLANAFCQSAHRLTARSIAKTVMS